MNTPTIGRIILLSGAAWTGARAAIITAVNDPPDDFTTIDVQPFLNTADTEMAGQTRIGSVRIYESEGAAAAAINETGGPVWAAHWMPYQQGQAAKTEDVTGKLQALLDDTRTGLANAEAKIAEMASTKAHTSEAGPMGGRLAQALLALAQGASGEQQQLVKNILDGVQAG